MKKYQVYVCTRYHSKWVSKIKLCKGLRYNFSKSSNYFKVIKKVRYGWDIEWKLNKFKTLIEGQLLSINGGIFYFFLRAHVSNEKWAKVSPTANLHLLPDYEQSIDIWDRRVVWGFSARKGWCPTEKSAEKVICWWNLSAFEIVIFWDKILGQLTSTKSLNSF